MMDDDALDRALAALPLEEPPASLHARILARTIYRPQATVKQWEVWLVATLAAIALWLSWFVLSTPRVAERLTERISQMLETGGFTSVNTLMWLAVGISAAWWLSQLSIPPRGRIENP
jgi:hypothetical protein